MPALLVVNMMLTGGVLAQTVLKKPPAAAPAAEAGSREGNHEAPAGEQGEGGHAPGAHAPGSMGPTVRLADFVVHLRDAESERYARMSFELEVGSEPDKERVNGSMVKVRELFLAYLSDRTVEELRGSEGIERTKKELLAKVTAAVPGTPVRAIYITDVVIQ